MPRADPVEQKIQMRAYTRALTRLKRAFPTEFDVFYIEEEARARAEIAERGVEGSQKPRGRKYPALPPGGASRYCETYQCKRCRHPECGHHCHEEENDDQTRQAAPDGPMDRVRAAGGNGVRRRPADPDPDGPVHERPPVPGSTAGG